MFEGGCGTSRERSGRSRAMPSVWAKRGWKFVHREECRVQRGMGVHVQPIKGVANQMPHVGVSAMGPGDCWGMHIHLCLRIGRGR